MKHFAGLDVSLDETTVRVADEEGRIVREARVPGEPEALVAFLQGLGLAPERAGLEACSLSAWLHEGLTAAGPPAACLETRRAEAATGATPNKTDRNDARGLARIVRTGRFRAVHVRSPACRSWRAPPAARRLVLNKMRDLENGVRAPGSSSAAPPARSPPRGCANSRRTIPSSRPRPSRCSPSSRPWPASWRSSPGRSSPSCATSRSAAG